MKKLTLVLSMLIALIGLNANAAMYIVGNDPFGNWDPSKGVEMTLQDDGTYTLDATLVQNDVWFIFAEAIGDWNIVNANRYDSGDPTSDLTVYAGVEFTPVKGATDKSFFFSGTAGETYTFSFNPTTGKAMITGDVVPFSPLTGQLFILGQVNGNNWDPSAGIEMATTDENIFTLTDAVITNSGDGFGFFSFTSKLGENSSDWSFTSYRRGAQADGTLVEDGVAAVLANWGSTGAFKVLPGTYDIEVNLSGNTVTLTDKGGEQPPVEMVYTVVGPEAIFGSDWDATDTINDMILENGIYTWTKENVELAAGSFGFKVVGNHNWANEWPVGFDNNWIKNVDEAGIYTIDITYDPEAADSLKITCVITKTGEIEPQYYTGNVYILGEVNDNGGWFTNKGVLMTRDAENNVYTATITTAGENIPEGEETGYSYFSFTKQLADSAADWDAIAPYRFGAVSEGDYWVTDETLGTVIPLQNNGQSFRVPAGKWNLTLSVDNMTLVIEAVAEPTYLRGDVNMDETVSIGDVTALIDYLLTQDATGINLNAADCNQDEGVSIADVTALIDYLLTSVWPAE